MQGRCTPGSRPIRNSAEAMVAPVLPADTIAEALPSRTSSAQRTSDESFFLRTLAPGSSSIAMTSVTATTSRPKGSPMSSGTPTRVTDRPSSSTARRAPAMISVGAKSPPIASKAMGSVKSVDLYGRTTLVPTAVGAHHVGQLGGGALGEHAARGARQGPVGRPATARLGFAGLALGYGHRSSLSPETGVPVAPRFTRTRGPQIGARPV